jgi:hypothetical protein
MAQDKKTTTRKKRKKNNNNKKTLSNVGSYNYDKETIYQQRS